MSVDYMEDDSVETGEENGPVMCLDVGDKRIGVAISQSRVIAKPTDPIMRIGRKQTLNAIENLIKEYGIETCILGLPYLESGEEGEQVEKTRAFARSLQRRIPSLTISFEDERYSSSEAKKILGTENVPKGRIDSVAAAVILTDWLGRLDNSKTPV